MKVLVIGAGVGGLAAARALSADGHQVTLFERAGTLRTDGAAITLWSNGTGILDDLGVSLGGFGAPIEALELRTWTGRPLARVNLARAAACYGHPHICLPRHRLVERLADGLRSGTIFFDRTCTGIWQNGDQVTAKFADGSTAEADLLIGADGHRSVLREHLWGADPTEPTGWTTWQGISHVPIEVPTSRRCLMTSGRSGLCGLMPAGEGLLYWWFYVRWSQGQRPPASPLADLRELFGHWASPIPEVLAALGDTEVGFHPHHRHRVPRCWGTGRVTLVGDAAHTMPPTRAQGANQALEDAWALAAALRKTDDVPSALRTYERERSKKAALVARRSGTEDINRYHPTLVRLIPNALATTYYTRWLKNISNYLQS